MIGTSRFRGFRLVLAGAWAGAAVVVSLAAEPAGWVRAVTTRLPDPASARVLLHAEASAWGVSTGGGVQDEAIAADAPTGAGFSGARRVIVPQRFPEPWGATAHSPRAAEAIDAGRVVFATLWMRAVVNQGGESAVVRVHLERTPEWEGLAETGCTLDGQWRQVHLTGVTRRRYDAGTVQVSIHLGLARQTVELGPMLLIDAGPADRVDLRQLPMNEIRWPGMEPDAPWRTEAGRRIDQHRRRDLRLVLRTPEGTPVRDTPVRLTQRRRTSSIGSFSGYALLREDADGARLRDTYARLFDRVTVPLYWADWGWLSQEDRYVALASWAAAQQPMDVRGHVLIYPGWRFMPTHLRALADDPAAFQEACLEQIRRAGERLRHVPFTEIDVTNELRQLTEIVEIVGREGVAGWFAEARRAFPGAKLCLNENSILSQGGATEAEQENLLDWYRFLRSRGQAPEVIGLQGHFSEGVTAPERLWEILDRIAAETAAEIQITEFDLNTLNDQAHAAYTRDFLTAVYAHPRVSGITLWGFWEGDHWLPAAAVWRRDWTPRPAAGVYEDLLGRTWRTHVETRTGPDGALQARVFTGDLLLNVGPAGGRTATVPIAVPAGPGEHRLDVTIP